MTVLMAGDLTSQELMQFLAEQYWPDEALCMASAEDAILFEKFVGPNDFLNRTEQGRVFCPEGECRWRRLGKRMRTVYLGTTCNTKGLEDKSEELNGLIRVERGFFFWGVRTDLKQEWIEQQVPHRFVYPVVTEKYPRGRVRLVLEEWKGYDGAALFSRFHHIEEARGE